MCRAARCKICRKTTWAGCGLHVAEVRARVPAEQWCAGHSVPTAEDASTSATWVRRLLGRPAG